MEAVPAVRCDHIGGIKEECLAIIPDGHWWNPVLPQIVQPRCAGFQIGTAANEPYR
jgi:hypothetical protein